ncbi:hypothetical protein L227DRAFT_348653 [Lentinus tigrinus ALCF2SS1-6]|uniref:Uncharacterized protein n=1 Tax=Lentinus tigrinus ALCF2SS1-6 TaxID=1328759 RepID=A0A5C2RTI2_9APHY|nr:hypothetical protein L227DRAFT_348653 [Lentinus tigrinus ALCF2SS1-6]
MYLTDAERLTLTMWRITAARATRPIHQAARSQHRRREARRAQRIRSPLVARPVSLVPPVPRLVMVPPLALALALARPRAAGALLPHPLLRATAIVETPETMATQGLVQAQGTTRAPEMITAMGARELATPA